MHCRILRTGTQTFAAGSRRPHRVAMPIATKDRLPTREEADENGDVWVWDKTSAYYSRWHECHWTQAGLFKHWMTPLPPPPKDDGKEM